MQLRTATFYAALLKAGSNAIKIPGKKYPMHSRNKKQSATAKYVSGQQNAYQRNRHLLHPGLNRNAVRTRKKADVDGAVLLMYQRSSLA